MGDFYFGWWTTGRDKAAVNLLDVVLEAIKQGKIKGKIGYVFLSRQPGEGRYSDEIIKRCLDNAIPIETLSAIKFEPELRKKDREKWRLIYHRQVQEKISRYPGLLAVLAGYMWVLSPEICQHISAINLHPALPGGPTGTWQEVIWQLLDKKMDETGAMMHLVTPILDRGPAVSFFRFPIKGKEWDELWEEFEELCEKKGFEGVKKDPGENLELFRKIRHEGEIRELPLIVQTLRSFANNELKVGQGIILDSKGNTLSTPLDLTEQVDSEIKGLDL